MQNLCLVMIATGTIFIDFQRITLPELHAKFHPHPFLVKNDFCTKKSKNA